MTAYRLSAAGLASKTIAITGSKSESNRLLILKALYPQIELSNLSNSDDTRVLQKALTSRLPAIDIHHAGTSMRFLTSFFAMNPNFDGVLTGSQRMQERPIGVLVDALRQLGAKIEYVGQEGYPPLHIRGVAPMANSVTIAADVSSQYLSSLLLTGSSFKDGLVLNLKGKLTSVPYLKMTLSLLESLGTETQLSDSQVKVGPVPPNPKASFTVESDWSSASYFYSITALAGTQEIELKSYKRDSLQGDAKVASFFEPLGVHSIYDESTFSVRLIKRETNLPEIYRADLADTPDLAQTIAVCCFGLGIACELSGLHTLKIKETDRLVALQNELQKFGADVSITDNHLSLARSSEIKPGVCVATYQDHRMAMAFAPLALRTSLMIESPEVVSKSYPEFWNDLESLGFRIES